MIRLLFSLGLLFLVGCPLDDSCRSHRDCPSQQSGEGAPTCVPPEATGFPGVGCNCSGTPDECELDVDCGSGFVCRGGGACGCPTPSVCVPGCTSDEECLSGQLCNEDAHCIALSCALSADCPSAFNCSEGACARTECQDDEGCEQGAFCVENLCFDELGECTIAFAIP